MNRSTGTQNLLNFPFVLSTSLLLSLSFFFCSCLLLLPYTSGLRPVGSSQREFVGFVPLWGLGMGLGRGWAGGLAEGFAGASTSRWPAQGLLGAEAGAPA